MIPGFDGLYSVSDHGRVRSEPTDIPTVGRQRGRILKPATDTKGYQFFHPYANGKHAPMKVHKAVALAFIGPPMDGMQINHRDGDKLNNRPDNLEWVTCADNIRHAWATGLVRRENRTGELHGRAKFTNAQAADIRKSPETCSRLAERFGVTKSTIARIKRGQSYAA